MRAEDLMLGDWVMGAGTPKQIAALGTEKAGFLDSRGDMFYHYYDNIEPIPLTLEILHHNGARTNDKKAEFWRENRPLVLKVEWFNGKIASFYGFVFERLTRICYVHELQHVWRSTGIDKKIEL